MKSRPRFSIPGFDLQSTIGLIECQGAVASGDEGLSTACSRPVFQKQVQRFDIIIDNQPSTFWADISNLSTSLEQQPLTGVLEPI